MTEQAYSVAARARSLIDAGPMPLDLHLTASDIADEQPGDDEEAFGRRGPQLPAAGHRPEQAREVVDVIDDDDQQEIAPQ